MAFSVIVSKRSQLLPTAKSTFAGGSGETSHALYHTCSSCLFDIELVSKIKIKKQKER